MKIRTKVNNIGFVPIIFWLSLICVGLFHEYISCGVGIAMSIWLFFKFKREKQIRFQINITTVSLGILVLFYLASALWAVDSGMAFIGFLKFLPVVLFLLCILQKKGSVDRIVESLPCVAAVMTLLSMVCMYVPVLEHYFNVANRLAGFFQYPNTFAIFLLVSELILLNKEKYQQWDSVYLLIIVGGILFTGSRTVFVLALLSNMLVFLFFKNKKIRIFGILCIIFGVAIVFLSELFLEESGIFGRLLQISLSESTFVGRILYYTDAFPLILKHPFGLGYMGHYYMQQSIQTGVYSVQFIHNDFLQIMLDVGWIPCLLFMAAIVESFLDKKNSGCRKLILLVLVLHSCFDFNLQFVAMCFLLMLFLNYDSGKEVILKNTTVWRTGMVMFAVIFLWGGTSLFLYHAKQYEIAEKLYPWNTQNQTKLLTVTKDVETLNKLADEIIERNQYVPIAYSVKATYAYSQGDFENLIKYKNIVFEKAPFQYSEYEEYCYMLINGIGLYRKAGDVASADVCEQELIRTYEKVMSLDDRLSEFGRKIKDQPVTELPEDIVRYVNALEE